MAPRRDPGGISDPGAHFHLSFGVRDEVPTARDAWLGNFLQEHASIAVGKPFRGYATTIWLDQSGELSAGPNQAGLNDAGRYYYGRDFFRARYGETFHGNRFVALEYSDLRRIW